MEIHFSTANVQTMFNKEEHHQYIVSFILKEHIRKNMMRVRLKKVEAEEEEFTLLTCSSCLVKKSGKKLEIEKNGEEKRRSRKWLQTHNNEEKFKLFYYSRFF
jgi:hypothetical protein